MLTAYIPQGNSLERREIQGGEQIPKDAVWFDLVSPAATEDEALEHLLGIGVPTREEMQEIEVSSRLYIEDDARFMTATLMYQSDTAFPKTTPVTFILTNHKLVTVRYEEPKPFGLISTKLARHCSSTVSGDTIMMDLLDAVIDRAADILERAGADIDRISRDIFQPEERRADRTKTYQAIFKRIGARDDLTFKVRESLVSIGRLVLFLANEAENLKWSAEMRAQLRSMQRDVQSLSDHVTYLSGKVTFLLDAMIGVMSVEQNNIIKLFSVAAVVLMPPTLIASIYGMNFKNMPELGWEFGYPMAIVLMVIAAILPYWFFKWKHWL